MNNIRKIQWRVLSIWLLVRFSAVAEIPAFTEEGFRVPQPGHTLEFPRDHGSHPDFKIEWWYITGHLSAGDGRPFGFQATFFRFAGGLDGPAEMDDRFGHWHLFSSQVALTDIENQQFYFDERLDRNGWDAQASSETLDHRHGPWSLCIDNPDTEAMHLQFTIQDRAVMDLTLIPSKPKVVFGPDGTSRKGSDPTARSYYITFPRLTVSGKLVLDGESMNIHGSAWMDHEIASRQLSDDLEGWDWTAIQLEDGREIKAYLLRQKDGSPSPFSQLIWIDKEGQLSYQDYGETGFTWDALNTWESPHTGAQYPTTVKIKSKDPSTGEQRTIFISPDLDDQEVRGSLNTTHYWEGSCTVKDRNSKIIGKAYLELAGYADSLTEALR